MPYPFKICDPVHGFIRFGEIEKRVINSRPFQRLRYIHQLGVTYLVYPGATHTRFEHSLGVMELATQIFDSIAAELPSGDLDYWRQILRLAALCHDMGHLPFSHTAEKELLPQGGHEKWTLQFIQSKELSAIWRELGPQAESDIVKLALSQSAGPLSAFEKLLAQTITEDNFGADRIDYLIRDAHYTGAGYGNFDYRQLIDSLRVLPYEKGISLGIAAHGMQSVESLWISRYMMYARVYHLDKVLAYMRHMVQFMCRFYRGGVPTTTEEYLEQTDFVILTQLAAAVQVGDPDAEVLLKRVPPTFDRAEMPHSAPRSESEQEARVFPVLCEKGGVLSSLEVSSFLHAIPLGQSLSKKWESKSSRIF